MTQTNSMIEEFKEEIRSILITSKDGLPLSKVNREYYEFLGKNIPYRSLGFNSAIELFKAVPDAVQVVDRGELYLYAVCNEKIAHIEKLVSKQKKNPKSVASRSRSAHYVPPGLLRNRSVHSVPPRMLRSSTYNHPVQNHQNPPRVPLVQLKKNMQDLVSRYPQGLSVQNIKYAYRTVSGTELNYEDYNYGNIVEFLKMLENENILTLRESLNMSVIFPFQRRANQNSVVHSEQVLGRNRASVEKTFIPECETSNENGQDYDYKTVLKNLQKVVECFPGGFPIDKLCDNYKKITGSVLVPMKMGYNSVQEFVIDFRDVFHVQENHAGDCILIDARLSTEHKVRNDNSTNHDSGDKKEIPEHILQNIYDLLKHFSDGINLEQFEELYKMNFGSRFEWKKFGYQSLESLLMSLEFNPPIRVVHEQNKALVTLSPKEPVLTQGSQKATVSELEYTIPEDAVLLDQPYTHVKIPYDLKYFPVIVASVESPGEVWLQLVSQTEQRNVELDDVMDQLIEFYQSPEADKYRIPEKYLEAGLNCAVIYSEDQAWHRGCIIGKPGPTSCKVLYYDYGTVDVVEKSLLRLLKQSFTVLPAQAFCARLANMKPLSTCFSLESSSRLFELCSEKPLMAHVTSKTYMNTNSVILCDTTGEDDIFINNILIDEGLVQKNDDLGDIRKSFEVTIPDRCNVYSGSPISIPAQMPTSVMCNIPQFGFPTHGFYNPVGSILSQFPVNPNHLANSVAADSFPPLVSASALGNSQIYNPPIFNHSLESNNVLDPTIFRRLEERALARKKLLEEGLNVPQATVEPIQSSKTRTLNCDLVNYDIQENQPERNEPDTPQNVENQGTDEMYDSSREEDDDESRNSTASDVGNPTTQLRFCKKVCFRDEKYSAYLINFNRQPCFTSAHLSSFIFGVDIVKRILHIQKYPSCHIVASREDHPGLFEELERLEMSGFTREDPTADKVVLYSLPDVLKILVFLNHNKEILVEDIEEIRQSFDPDDEYWTTNEESVKANTHEETLQEQLNALKEERRLLLRVMLAEDYSSIYDAKRLLKIHEDIHDAKVQLSELRAHSKLKSASEQAREFLERAKLDFQTEKSPDGSTCVASTSATPSTPTTPVHTQTNVAAVDVASASQNSQNTNVVAVGQTAIAVQGYAAAPSAFGIAQPIPVNYPHTFYPNGYVFPQQNLPYTTPGMRISNPPYYYSQWKQ